MEIILFQSQFPPRVIPDMRLVLISKKPPKDALRPPSLISSLTDSRELEIFSHNGSIPRPSKTSGVFR